MRIDRREFLRILGITAGGAVAFKGIEHLWAVPEELFEKAKYGPGIETWKNSICRLCSVGCGIRVRLVDGVPVRILGNPIYPVNRGGMCPLGETGLDVLFHPDRLRGPIHKVRNGDKTEWESITWDEAISLVAERLKSLRESNRPHRLAVLSGEDRGLTADFFRWFLTAYGSPNFIFVGENASKSVPYFLTQGLHEIPSYSLRKPDYILNFGCNFLEEEPATVKNIKDFAIFRDRKLKEKVKIVSIDSRASITAIKSDKWFPINPGTYGAFALGVAYIMLRERHYNEDFIRRYTSGFEDWKDSTGAQHQGFRSFVLNNFYPEKVSELTGVPAENIIQVAREFTSYEHPIAVSDHSAFRQTNGVYALMVIHCLNALVGNLNKEWGLVFPDPSPSLERSDIPRDKVARKGLQLHRIDQAITGIYPFATGSLRGFVDSVVSVGEYPIDALFVYRCNPAFTHPNREAIIRALEKIPFVVSFSSFLDETAEHADLILPDHTYLERWSDVPRTETMEFAHLGIQQPVVEPFYDTRHTGDSLIDIARKIGGTVESTFQWENF